MISGCTTSMPSASSTALGQYAVLAMVPLVLLGCRLTEPTQSEVTHEVPPGGAADTPTQAPEPDGQPDDAPDGVHHEAAVAADTIGAETSPRASTEASSEANIDPSPVRVVYPGQSLGHLVADLRSAVVNIRTTTKVKGGPASMYTGAADDTSLGSGVLIDKAGHVLTNDHVLAQARDLRVVLAAGNGWREVPARIVGRAPDLDIALLAVSSELAIEPAMLGSSSALHVGEWVVALGNPFGREITASAGIIASTEGAENIPSLDSSPMRYRSLLVTDAAIHPGNSGGPLVDTSGQVVGISTAIAPRGTPLGLVIPIDHIKAILPSVKRDGRFRRSWLGVFVHPVDAPATPAPEPPGPRGALVSEVVPDSPANKAGIRAGDIIIRFDGQEVDHRNLPWLAAITGQGRRVPVVVRRDDGELTLQLVSALMPE